MSRKTEDKNIPGQGKSIHRSFVAGGREVLVEGMRCERGGGSDWR